MRITHVTPTYFGCGSVVGGAERYVTELARWTARRTDTTLVSFGRHRWSGTEGRLRIQIYPVRRFIRGNPMNPLSLQFIRSLLPTDVIHIHQVSTVVSDLAVLVGSLLRRAVFVTDHGGGADLVFHHRLPLLSGYRGAVAQSRFALDRLPPQLLERAVVIPGGIDTSRFCPAPAPSHRTTILFVGRLLPHKGVDYLIEAFRKLSPRGVTLRIVGRMQHERYYADLRRMADHRVDFVHDADDRRLVREYHQAIVTVLPSVHTTCYGDYTPVPELMGFTLLESQACGTPVICTDAGAMGEFVLHGRTGLVVPQNSSDALAEALSRLLCLPGSEYTRWQGACVEWAGTFNWASVVDQHLALYRGDAPRKRGVAP